MHILFLTDNFPPEVNAPASRTFEHAREWVRQGHRVTVITCVPNFPHGKVADGYRNRWRQEETVDGIRVIRVWSYIAANEGFAKRTLDYLSYLASATLASGRVRDADVVVATSPQFFAAVAGYLSSLRLGLPFVFELRDLWPESIRAVSAMKDGTILRVLEKIELFLYEKAAAIVSVTNAFKRNLTERGIDPAKISVITNGVDLSRYSRRSRPAELAARFGLENAFVAGYVGTHGMAHALDTVLDVAVLAREQGHDDMRFLLLGAGAAKVGLIDRIARENLTNVIALDTVGKSEVVAYWSLLNASLIHLRRTPLFETVIPSKLFECMAMGLPVVHGVPGESAEIVEATGCGVVVPPQDAPRMLAALLRIRDEEGFAVRLSAGGLAGSKAYDRQTLAHRMLSVLQKVVDARANPVPGN